MIPTFPLPAPDMALANKAIGSDVLNPHISDVSIVLSMPSRMMYFRPYRSLAVPHGIAVRHCEREYIADVAPAQKAMSGSGTLKLSIISGR